MSTSLTSILCACAFKFVIVCSLVNGPTKGFPLILYSKPPVPKLLASIEISPELSPLQSRFSNPVIEASRALPLSIITVVSI